MSDQIFIQLIFALAGVFFIIFGFYKGRQIHDLFTKGIKAEGVVFSIEKPYDNFISISDSNDFNNSSTNSYPVIRYVTQDKEWITQKYAMGSNPCMYNEGDKVTVYYDPNETSTFVIDSKLTRLAQPLLTIVGCLLLIAAIVLCFVHIPINH